MSSSDTSEDSDQELIGEDCPICMAETRFMVGLDGCQHRFCMDCLNQWNSSGVKTCPMCRSQFDKILEPVCSICSKTNRILAWIDCCNDVFCYGCIENWSKKSSNCPVCKKQFSKVMSDVREGNCFWCKDEMEKGCHLAACGHSFCYTCIKDIKKSFIKSRPLNVARNEHILRCPVCRDRLRDIMPFLKDDKCVCCLGTIKAYNRGATDGCDHYSCYSCLVEWREFSNCCPKCDAEFTKIVHMVLDNGEKVILMMDPKKQEETKDWRWTHTAKEKITEKFIAWRIDY